jgi:hypothetical protein
VPQKRKGSLARPPVRVRERKLRILTVSVDKARLKKYQDAAARGFRGNISDFFRAAADALAAQLAAQLAENEKELEQGRTDFWRGVAKLLNDKPPQMPGR